MGVFEREFLFRVLEDTKVSLVLWDKDLSKGASTSIPSISRLCGYLYRVFAYCIVLTHCCWIVSRRSYVCVSACV